MDFSADFLSGVNLAVGYTFEASFTCMVSVMILFCNASTASFKGSSLTIFSLISEIYYFKSLTFDMTFLTSPAAFFAGAPFKFPELNYCDEPPPERGPALSIS